VARGHIKWQIGSKIMAFRLRTTKWLSMPTPRGGSIPAARELLAHARDAGADIEALVRRAGLFHSAAAMMAPGWSGQISRIEFVRLYAECTWALDAHASRQENRRPLSKAELDLMCHCIITCRTLREAIDRASAFSAMLIPRTARLTLEISRGVAELRMETIRATRNVSAYISDLTGLSTHLRLFGWLIGEEIVPRLVALRYPPLVSREIDTRLLPYAITHDAPENMLQFADRYLGRPIVRTPSELERLLERFPFDLEQVQSKNAPLSEQVRIALRSALAQGTACPTEAVVASQFSIGPATLKRRLSDEGLTFSMIRASCLRDHAHALLSDVRLSVAEVAARSGFSDTTTFSRAFRRWNGVSPGRWREYHILHEKS
jgi:AraC-like DNA-binding protein